MTPEDPRLTIPRVHDIPRSFYRGMWLRLQAEGPPYHQPTAEVVSVGRARVTIREAGGPEKRLTIPEAKEKYRKVYASTSPETLPDWVKKRASFSIYNWPSLTIREIRWGYVSAETPSGVLLFVKLTTLAEKATPRLSAWDRLRDE